KVPGFRPGKAPLNFIRQKLKDDFVKKETIEVLKEDVLEAAVKKENLAVIGPLEVEVENDKDLPKFKFLFSVWPKVKLGDYKKALAEIKSGKKIETAKNLAEAQSKATREKKKQVERLKGLGQKTPQEQENELEEKILQTLLTTAEVEIPEILIEGEVEEHLLPAREEQIKRLGLSLKNYLQAKKGQTLTQYKKQLRKEAEEIIKLRLILQEIADAEGFASARRFGGLEKEDDVRYIMERLREIVNKGG
ncbi:MAG: hypothetical protein FJ044_05535, partial [Candidatus Cloacimonetes bacterium]|nr:hypothetical protein [Candidatus Cloacimonadota bacterium]